MPDWTIASAVWRIRSSLTLQANLFQLFHPMGGTRAKGGFSASEEMQVESRTADVSSKRVLAFTDKSPDSSRLSLKLILSCHLRARQVQPRPWIAYRGPLLRRCPSLRRSGRRPTEFPGIAG